MRLLLLAVLVASDVAVAPDAVLPEGAQLVARMNTTIGTRHALGVDRIADETRAGAPFAATIETTIVDEYGRTRLPAGAVLRGHITRVARGYGIQRAAIELAIDRIENRPLAARVVKSDVQQLESSDAGAQVDTTVLWGMVVGGLVFGIPGVAIGHGFAGGLGAVKAVRAREVEAWLAAGSTITVELGEPLRLDRCLAARDGAPPC
jgi:hypothetical protein